MKKKGQKCTAARLAKSIRFMTKPKMICKAEINRFLNVFVQKKSEQSASTKRKWAS